MKHKDDIFQNSAGAKTTPLVMYIDMNSYFASCEQQRHTELRGLPLGVLTYDSPNAAVIAASKEAKDLGVKTGMRLTDAKMLCPNLLTTTTHPAWYRQIHVDIIAIIRSYCEDVITKSIDEAVANFHSYRFVYKDLEEVARQIKADIAAKYDYLKCSIGIAPNSFLAKVGTELRKRDGLITITGNNIDEHLATMSLTGLPGIASKNERRLQLIGIRNPVEMRHASPALLRKAFGGVVGDYWHRRLNFWEVDMYSRAENRTMSATRTLSSQQARDPQVLDSMLIALCTRLEMRLVKSNLFCKELSFSIRYKDGTRWDTAVKMAAPMQDAMEMVSYIKERIHDFERSHNLPTLLTDKTLNLGVGIQSFMDGKVMQYSLFDNRIKKDTVRKVMYDIKDVYEQRDIVRKGCEMIIPDVMKDAIGFGSVRDMGENRETGRKMNKFLLEEDKEGVKRMATLKKKELAEQREPDYNDIGAEEEWEGVPLIKSLKHLKGVKEDAAAKPIDHFKWGR